jgi:hypothetical protein
VLINQFELLLIPMLRLLSEYLDPHLAVTFLDLSQNLKINDGSNPQLLKLQALLKTREYKTIREALSAVKNSQNSETISKLEKGNLKERTSFSLKSRGGGSPNRDCSQNQWPEV